MNDESLRSMQSDWKSQPDSTDAVLQRLRRNRWRPHMGLGVELVGCALALMAGIWFAWSAFHFEVHRLLFSLSAGILLLAAPALAIATFAARRASLPWHDATPEALLQTGIRRTEGSLRAIRIARWHLAIIGAFVVALWIFQWLGHIDARRFLVVYTLICVALSLAAGIWCAYRERQLRGERAACIRLLEALHEGAG